MRINDVYSGTLPKGLSPESPKEVKDDVTKKVDLLAQIKGFGRGIRKRTSSGTIFNES